MQISPYSVKCMLLMCSHKRESNCSWRKNALMGGFQREKSPARRSESSSTRTRASSPTRSRRAEDRSRRGPSPSGRRHIRDRSPVRRRRTPDRRDAKDKSPAARRKSSPPGRRDVRDKSPLRESPPKESVYGHSRQTLPKSLISDRRKRGHTPPEHVWKAEESKVDWLNRSKNLSNQDKARIFGKAESFSPPFIKEFTPTEDQLKGLPPLKVPYQLISF